LLQVIVDSRFYSFKTVLTGVSPIKNPDKVASGMVFTRPTKLKSAHCVLPLQRYARDSESLSIQSSDPSKRKLPTIHCALMTMWRKQRLGYYGDLRPQTSCLDYLFKQSRYMRNIHIYFSGKWIVTIGLGRTSSCTSQKKFSRPGL